MTVSIIPRPAELDAPGGELTLDRATTITAPDALAPAARLLAQELRAVTGWNLPVDGAPPGSEPGGTIAFEYVPDSDTGSESGEEGYTLDVGAGGVRIRARGISGARYARETLRQLLPAEVFRAAGSRETLTVPFVTISDRPRYDYRGVMLDVARHFLPKPDLLRLIAAFANLKINRVHLHLTDDQGWRVEIREYPRLTEVGAWRRRSSRGDWRHGVYDETPHGGFYTQDDIREIVAFAAERGITILPEIDVPGHSQAAIAAYPHLAGLQEAPEVWTRWGINDLVLDPRTPTVEFFQNVLDEVMELFSGPIGLGGDEVPFTQWRSDATLAQFAVEQGLDGVEGLHEWFITQLADHVHAAGREVFVWDEMAGADLPEGTIVHAWRTDEVISRAIETGKQVVVCTEKDLYFDYVQAPGDDEPIPMGKVITVEQVAGYEAPAGGVLGIQANLWSEHMASPQRVEYQAFPRVVALAEAAWGAREGRDLDDFMARLPRHLERLDAAGVTYRAPEGPTPAQQRPGVLGRLHGEGFVAGRIEGQPDA